MNIAFAIHRCVIYRSRKSFFDVLLIKFKSAVNNDFLPRSTLFLLICEETSITERKEIYLRLSQDSFIELEQVFSSNATKHFIGVHLRLFFYFY